MSTELLNTPGYYYAIAYWLSAFVIACIYRTEFEGIRSVALDGSVLAALLLFMNLTDGIAKWLFVPAMLVIILVVLWYIRFSCGFTLAQTGYFGAKILVNAEFGGSFCWQVYYNFIDDIPGRFLTLWKWGEMAVMFLVIYAVIYFLERYLKADREELRIMKKELLGVYAIVIMVFCISNMSYLNQDWLFSGVLAKDIFIIRTLVDVCGIVLLYAYNVQMKEVQMRLDMDIQQSIMKMQYQNYQISKESIDMVNQKYHDLKNQIVLLKAEANTEKSIQYLEQMEKEIKIYEAQNKTGNRVLDIVLSSKSVLCQGEDIELKCVVEGAQLEFMEDMDISCLFGNMLDNAIEAVRKIPEKERRLIRLYVVQEKQFLRICTENYCEEEIRFKNRMPVTTKKDKHLHGYGMKSIQNIVKKYGGSVVAELKDHWFVVKILVPLASS